MNTKKIKVVCMAIWTLVCAIASAVSEWHFLGDWFTLDVTKVDPGVFLTRGYWAAAGVNVIIVMACTAGLWFMAPVKWKEEFKTILQDYVSDCKKMIKG